MEQGPYWEAGSRSAYQEVPRLSRNPKVHYHVHKTSPTVPTLKRMIQSTLGNPTTSRSISIPKVSQVLSP
jgi:hypothetical protein